MVIDMRFSWNLALGHVSRLDSWFPIDLELKCWLIWLNLAKNLIFFKNGKNSLKKKKKSAEEDDEQYPRVLFTRPHARVHCTRASEKNGARFAPRMIRSPVSPVHVSDLSIQAIGLCFSHYSTENCFIL